MDFIASSSCLNLHINSSSLRMKHAFKESSLKTRDFSVISSTYSVLKPKLVTQKYCQPPPFVVGGFVGSKSVEHKNSSNNYSNLLGQIISFLTIQEKNIWNIEQPAIIHHISSKRNPAVSSVPLKINLTNISSLSKMHPNKSKSTVVSPASVSSGATMENCPLVKCDNSFKPFSCIKQIDSSHTSSKASDSLGTDICAVSKVDPLTCATAGEMKLNTSSTIADSWIKDIFVIAEDSDNDSDWDCADDFHSENGEIVDSMKWNGDFLSPISSPVNPPLSTPQQQVRGYDYDSDESDIWDSCERNESDEEDEKERKLAEQRIVDANRRWNENIDHHHEEDSYQNRKSKKKVRFLSKNLVRVRPMLTWSHAYREARKGEWERLARDSVRFRERIASVSNILQPVLDPNHRESIWRRLHSET